MHSRRRWQSVHRPRSARGLSRDSVRALGQRHLGLRGSDRDAGRQQSPGRDGHRGGDVQSAGAMKRRLLVDRTNGGATQGFVLVGVVMMVLALTILGLSLFSLSTYEAQFMQQS